MKFTSVTDLEELLAERPFEMLTEAEKAAVLALMPEWEYQRLHQILVRSKATMKKSPKPDPAIRANLMTAMRQKSQQKQPGLLVKMANYRMPAWQVAAGFALLLSVYFSMHKTPNTNPQVETVYVNNTDTIYKEVAMPVADTASKTENRRVNVKPSLAKSIIPADAIPMEAVADSAYRRQPNISEIPDTLPGFQFSLGQPTGRSANEMNDLWQFLGDVY